MFISPLWAKLIGVNCDAGLASKFGTAKAQKLKSNHIVLFSWIINRKVDHLFRGMAFEREIPAGFQGPGAKDFVRLRCSATYREFIADCPFLQIGTDQFDNIVQVSQTAEILTVAEDKEWKGERVFWLTLRNEGLFATLLNEAVRKRIVGDIPISSIATSEAIFMLDIPAILDAYTKYFNQSELNALLTSFPIKKSIDDWRENATEMAWRLEKLARKLKEIRDALNDEEAVSIRRVMLKRV